MYSTENCSSCCCWNEKLGEECGVYGVVSFGNDNSCMPHVSPLVAMGLHALQHRGQEAAGISSRSDNGDFYTIKRTGYVRDNFTRKHIIDDLPGMSAIGHVRYSTTKNKPDHSTRDAQPLFANLASGGVAVVHNGNITNADLLRSSLVQRGSIFQSCSDTECIVHLIACSDKQSFEDKLSDALGRIEGAYSIIVMNSTQMIGARDPYGIRPLVLGRITDKNIWVFASETCALDIIGAEYVRDVAAGEMLVIDNNKLTSHFPFKKSPSRFCIFEYVYFSRPDSYVEGQSVYQVRYNIGMILAQEGPVEADIICPVPDSGIPSAMGYSQESGIPMHLGIVKNQYVGRTFIEPTNEFRQQGVRLKLNVNRSVVEGKSVVLVDDSLVRGTTSRKIQQLLRDAGAREVHFRIASPPTVWPCYYGVDTPDRDGLMAAQMSLEEMRKELQVDSIHFVSLDGLYKASGCRDGRVGNDEQRRFCDACFSGDYFIKIGKNTPEGS